VTSGRPADPAPQAPPDQRGAGERRPDQPPAGAVAGRAAAVWWAGIVVLSAGGIALTAVAGEHLTWGDRVSNLAASAAALAYATLGALIVRRAGNLVGRLMLGEGTALAVMAIGSAYATAGLAARPAALPAAGVVGALAEDAFVPVFIGIAATFLWFPSGRLPSPRWRPVAWAFVVAAGLATAGFLVSPRVVALPAPGGDSLLYRNPLGIRPLGPILSAALVGSLNELDVVLIIFLAPALASLVIRYRTGGRLLRQQLKWLALIAAAVIICQVIAGLAIATGHGGGPFESVPFLITPVIVLFGIPAAMTIAILRHSLFDIDLIISRALVYTLLSATVTALYAGIVLGVGTFAGHRGGPALTIAAAVSIALLFQPARHRAQRLANRLVYGERATPYQVLADFAADMAGQLDLGEALDRLVSLLAHASGAISVQAWIRVGTELHPIAVWPAGSVLPAPVGLGGTGGLGETGDLPDGLGAPAAGGLSQVVGVRHGDELLGALALGKPRNEPLTPAEDKLLEHLASQAGLVLRNAQLTAELRASIVELQASRRRLVEAQDAERRKIERDLHDGAQQQLVALAIQLGVLEGAADDPGLVRELAPQLKAAARAALADLRDLARGIYPPLLAEQGLAGALSAQAAKAPLPVRVEVGPLGRYAPDTESTVYFCVLEALQNAAKHAGAARVTVTIRAAGDTLEFSVTDDGPGFDPARTRHGSGLQGMTDRAAALGGTIDVRSRPGHGTAITGQLPATGPAGTGESRNRLAPAAR
jgi:signal transduction histidine kinase